MQDNSRKLTKAIKAVMDEQRPIYGRFYQSRPGLKMYKLYIPEPKLVNYRFHQELIAFAQARLDADEKTLKHRATSKAIPLFLHDMLSMLESGLPIYASNEVSKEITNTQEPEEDISISAATDEALLPPSSELELPPSFDTRLNLDDYKNAYQLNQAIEKLIAAKGANQANSESYTTEEKAFINHYSGYGGLEKYGATGKGLLYEYYTPIKVIEVMWKLAYKHGFDGGAVLEPSAGTGKFLRYLPANASCTAYEINHFSGTILSLLYPQAQVVLLPFETMFIANNKSIKDRTDHLPKFDLVIGNPPYGEMYGRYAGMGEKAYTKAHNYIEYFVSRGLDVLKPGGLLIYIVGAEVANGGKLFLSQGKTPAKEMIARKANLLEAHKMPNGLFERTDVLSEIIVARRK